MPRIRTSFLLAASVAVGASVPSAIAQQATGVPGPPSVTTTTLSGKQPSPPPDPPFGGVVREKASRSTHLAGRRASCRPRVRPTSC